MTDAWYEQEHTGCGGTFCIVVRPSTKEWRIACKRCQSKWEISHPMWPTAPLPESEFQIAEDLK